MPRHSSLRPAVGLMFLFAFTVAASPGGCGGSEEKPKTTTTATDPTQQTTDTPAIGATPGAPVAAKIEVTPAKVDVKVKDAQQLAAAVKDKDGKDVTGATVKWSSSDETLATVDATGKVTAVAAGTVTIKACVDAVCGEAALTIPAPPKLIQPDVAMGRVVTAGSTAMDVGGKSLKGGGSVRSATLEPLPGAPPRWMGWMDGAVDMGLLASPRLYVKTIDPLCDTAADPIGADGVPLWKTNSTGIAAGTFYCLLRAEIGPPKTVPSAIAISRQPICAILKLVPYETFKFDGTKQEVKGPKPAECYAEFGKKEEGRGGFGGPSEGGESTEVAFSVIANRPGTLGKGGVWDESYEVANLTGSSNELALQKKLVTKSGDGWIAAASVVTNASQGREDAFAYYLDWKKGVVLFEQKTQHFNSTPQQTSDCCYSTHARLLVKGKVDENGVFSEVTHYEGVHSQLTSANFTLPGITNLMAKDNAKLLSIRGNPKDGYKTHEYCSMGQCSPPAGTTAPTTLPVLSPSSYVDKVACSGDPGATCAGNDGIKITKASDLDFTMLPSAPTFTSSTTWFNAMGVLSFDAVTWADTQ